MNALVYLYLYRLLPICSQQQTSSKIKTNVKKGKGNNYPTKNIAFLKLFL